jgi:putative FmdB family regulatory protein
MPTYDYQCPKGHIFEVFQSIKDEPLALCPTCGEVASRQLSAGMGLLFKGSGFYITDYKNKSKKAENKTTEIKSTAKNDASVSGSKNNTTK